MRQMIRNFKRQARQSEVLWRYGFNFVPSLNYRFASRGAYADTIARILAELNSNGIAVASVGDLGGVGESFAELSAGVDTLLKANRHRLDELKLQANDPAIGEKKFNVELLGSFVDFDPESVFARFALQDTLLDIANAYFGMLVKLRYYNVWYTFATDSEARESQLWHYDREDNYILKVFLYLNDVDEGAGPFTYAPQTHRKGRLNGAEPEYFLERNVRRTTDEQMSKVVARDNWIRAAGKKGTIVFADTRGFHKGGEARTSDRLMYTCMYTSPASESQRLLKFDPLLRVAGLSREQLSALEIG